MALKTIPLATIRENEVALRTVNRASEKYLGLVDSIKTKGFLGAITVREKTDNESGEPFYELVDGLHRFNAAKDAGVEEINVDVVSLDDDEVMEAQILTNIHKIETKPMEYSKQLVRILNRNPLMSESELANKLGKSSQWIKDRLGLNKISNEGIINAINDGSIKLANAYALAKLPNEEQGNFVEAAATQQPDEFVPMISQRVKELREAARQGREAEPQEFQPTAHLQKSGDIKAELQTGEVAKVLCAGLNSAPEGFNAAIKWVLHLDEKSVEAQKARYEERQKAKAERAEKRKAEAAAKKAEKAKKAAEEAEKVASELNK